MTASPLDAPTGFTALGVPPELVDVLAGQGISEPFPIQVATLPDSLAGRDVLGRGRTGSGKTLAFGLALLANLAASGRGHRPRPRHPRGLVLVPTRELATQVETALKPLASAVGLTTVTVFGGVSQRVQVDALARGTDVVIACPGRLEDLMRQGQVRLGDVTITVLDEADHMADLGFLPGVRRILDATDRDAQRLLFSATLDNGVDVLVRRYLDRPVSHSVEDDSTEPDVDHHVLTVTAADRPAVVHELASGQGRAVLFTRTKRSARKLARDLTSSGVPAVDLHGNLSQAARDRNLGSFRNGGVRVLVATDVAARGIHVDDISLVVHVDPPAEHKAYLHRSGRTARAGASGIVVTLQTSAQRNDVTTMTRRAGIRATHSTVRVGSPEVAALVGPRAAFVAAEPGHATTGRDARTPNGGGRRNGAGRTAATGRGERAAASRTSRPSGGGSRVATKPSMSAAEFSARSRRGR